MPTTRDMVLFVRDNRVTYSLWLRAIKRLRMDGDLDIAREIDETMPLLFSDRECTCAVLYAMGYGRHRERVMIKVVELRLTS